MARVEQTHALRIVGSLGHAARAAHIDYGYRLTARIAVGPRIHAQQRPQIDVERGLFFCFADRGVLDRLAEIDEAAGNCPSVGKIAALDQNDPVANLRDHVGGDRRTYGPWHGWDLNTLAAGVHSGERSR